MRLIQIFELSGKAGFASVEYLVRKINNAAIPVSHYAFVLIPILQSGDHACLIGEAARHDDASFGIGLRLNDVRWKILLSGLPV